MTTATTDDGRRRRDALALAHLGLAWAVAGRYRPGRLDFDGRLSAAIWALLQAATDYDPARGPFAAFAAVLMRRQIGRDARDDRTIAVPRWATPEARAAAPRAGSLGDLRAEGPAPDPDTGPSEAACEARSLLAVLSPRRREFVRKWMDGTPLAELAGAAGISYRGAHNRLHRALETMRRFPPGQSRPGG